MALTPEQQAEVTALHKKIDDQVAKWQQPTPGPAGNADVAKVLKAFSDNADNIAPLPPGTKASALYQALLDEFQKTRKRLKDLEDAVIVLRGVAKP